MKSRMLITIALILLLAGCTPTAQPPIAPPEPEPLVELSALLPSEVGYDWFYAGFAEYGHRMSLDGIHNDEEVDRVIYDVSGEVDDVAGEGPAEIYEIDLQYIIEGGELLRRGGGPRMMDEHYDEIILLQYPLEVGSSWSQTVYKNPGGDAVDLACTLTGINLVNGALAFTVEYRWSELDYEIRTFTEGKGLTSYLRTLPIGDHGAPVELGYAAFDWNP